MVYNKIKVARVIEKLNEYAPEEQSRYRAAVNRSASNADLASRPILNKGKSPRDRPSARNVQFKLPEQLTHTDIPQSLTQKNATSYAGQKFFESKMFGQKSKFDPTRPDQHNSAVVSRRTSPRE